MALIAWLVVYVTLQNEFQGCFYQYLLWLFTKKCYGRLACSTGAVHISTALCSRDWNWLLEMNLMIGWVNQPVTDLQLIGWKIHERYGWPTNFPNGIYKCSSDHTNHTDHLDYFRRWKYIISCLISHTNLMIFSILIRCQALDALFFFPPSQ